VNLNLIALGALGAVMMALVLTLVSSAVHRRRRQRRAQRREVQMRRVRPHLVAMASGEGEKEDEDVIDAVAAEDADLLAEAAVEMLGKLRGEAHSELVALLAGRGLLAAARRQLTARSPDSRARAALLLGATGDRDSVADVARMLDDPVPEVGRVAARTLGKQGDSGAVAPLLASLDGSHRLPLGLVATSLLAIGRTAIEPLRAGLASAGRNGRVASAEVLGRLGAVESIDGLLAALADDPDREVRLRCAHALGRIGAPKGAPALTRLLTTTDDVVMRAICARSLGEVGGPATVALLVTAINDSQHAVAGNAAEALVALGPAGMAALETMAVGGGSGAPYARQALAREQLRNPPEREGASA